MDATPEEKKKKKGRGWECDVASQPAGRDDRLTPRAMEVISNRTGGLQSGRAGGGKESREKRKKKKKKERRGGSAGGERGGALGVRGEDNLLTAERINGVGDGERGSSTRT